MTTELTDLDVPHPSLAASIARLQNGHTHVVAKRLDGDEISKDLIKETRLTLRNTVAAAVGRAKGRTGHGYNVENGEMVTKGLDTVVCIVVTRTA